jgi:putative ABC transport system substrate-binding protein
MPTGLMAKRPVALPLNKGIACPRLVPQIARDSLRWATKTPRLTDSSMPSATLYGRSPQRWSDPLIERRTLLAAFGAAAVAAPFESFAQQHSGKMPRIGWLAPGTQGVQDLLEEYRRGMRELGYVESRNVETEYLYADGQIDLLPGHAATLVAHKVDLIVTAGTPGCLAAKQATTVTPIVFAVSSDPLSTGVVTSLARPGGNITGLSLMASDLSAKRLELLRNLLPDFGRVAVLWDSSNPGMALRVRETAHAAEQLKIVFFDAGARDLDGLEASFATLNEQRPQALVVTAEAFTNRHLDRILDFTMRNRIPAVYEDGRFAQAGGLMAYGPSIPDLFRRAATYVDKILKGAKPADLPVEQPAKFELVINLKTAKALGLSIPESFLLRADKVIE